jgi:hypothetical protein
VTYRVSALGAAALRMWRGWTVIVPVVVVNATIQALLVTPSVVGASTALIIALALVSYLVLLVAYGLLLAAALDVPNGRAGWRAAARRLRSRGASYAVWATGLALLVAAGWAVYLVPGLLVLAATPFVLLAVLDARGSPVRVDVLVIRRRPWRWMATAVIVGGISFLGVVAGGLTMFFLRGALGATVVWLVAGFAVAWVTVAWGLIYRNALGGDSGEGSGQVDVQDT